LKRNDPLGGRIPNVSDAAGHDLEDRRDARRNTILDIERRTM